jgi:hypothetical protein
MENLDFGFVGDRSVRLVLEAYYAQAAKALEAGSYLGAIVGYGAVAEGLLTYALLQRETDAMNSGRARKDKQGKAFPVQEWFLPNLIEVLSNSDSSARQPNRLLGH